MNINLIYFLLGCIFILIIAIIYFPLLKKKKFKVVNIAIITISLIGLIESLYFLGDIENVGKLDKEEIFVYDIQELRFSRTSADAYDLTYNDKIHQLDEVSREKRYLVKGNDEEYQNQVVENVRHYKISLLPGIQLVLEKYNSVVYVDENIIDVLDTYVLYSKEG